MSPCYCCTYGDVAEGSRKVAYHGCTFVQNNGGVICNHCGTKTIDLRDGDMVCSAFQRKEDDHGNQGKTG